MPIGVIILQELKSISILITAGEIIGTIILGGTVLGVGITLGVGTIILGGTILGGGEILLDGGFLITEGYTLILVGRFMDILILDGILLIITAITEQIVASFTNLTEEEELITMLGHTTTLSAAEVIKIIII